MSISAASVLNSVAVKLFDPDFIRWSVFELYQDLNDGQREIIFFKPDSNMVNEAFTLAAAIKQTLPTGGVFLFDVVDNVTSGRLISMVDRKLLSAAAPTWHTNTTTETVGIKHYSYNENDPKYFYVYPKPSEIFDVNILYSKLAEDVTATSTGIDMLISNVTGDLTIADEYKNVLIDYIMYRAFSKDSEYSSATRAQMHYQAFMNGLGARTQVEDKEDPNRAEPSVSERSRWTRR